MCARGGLGSCVSVRGVRKHELSACARERASCPDHPEDAEGGGAGRGTEAQPGMLRPKVRRELSDFSPILFGTLNLKESDFYLPVLRFMTIGSSLKVAC